MSRLVLLKLRIQTERSNSELAFVFSKNPIPSCPDWFPPHVNSWLITTTNLPAPLNFYLKQKKKMYHTMASYHLL